MSGIVDYDQTIFSIPAKLFPFHSAIDIVGSLRPCCFLGKGKASFFPFANLPILCYQIGKCFHLLPLGNALINETSDNVFLTCTSAISLLRRSRRSNILSRFALLSSVPLLINGAPTSTYSPRNSALLATLQQLCQSS